MAVEFSRSSGTSWTCSLIRKKKKEKSQIQGASFLEKIDTQTRPFHLRVFCLATCEDQ